MTPTEEELIELRAWRINVTSALRRPGGSLYAEVPEHIRELRASYERTADLCQAVRTVLEGFDRGIFCRSIVRDDNPSWAIELLPYLVALKRVKELTEI